MRKIFSPFLILVLVATTSYSGRKEVEFLSGKTGVRFVVVPHDVGATPAAKDWFALMDQVLASIQ